MLAVRPEKIALATAEGNNRVAGTVVASAFLGARSHFQVKVEGVAQPIAVAVQSDVTIALGVQVTLSWRAEAMVVLEG